MSKDMMTLNKLIEELKEIQDQNEFDKFVNVYTYDGKLTANIELSNDKWVVFIDGGNPFYEQNKSK